MDRSVAKALEAFGAHEAAQFARNRPADPGAQLFADQVEAYCCFLSAMSQWRTVSFGMGGFAYQGIDYPSLEAVFRLRRVPPEDVPDLFEQIQVMEGAAVEYLNDRH
ncbi:DUF1799 domain-containing protein [Chitinasiproducens palmae]|uniref:DUF1799 domain-containing protein n=1 Tax=Chitinasiproducens palmae TaxID=1770053 RepID=A0A1H2PY94_9BURK|nr:DUF1799 domain-containing protein [Chitinasiproducens palmae]SDV51681.1 Phage related hypothetical protein [Chitinasiproducens palmae]